MNNQESINNTESLQSPDALLAEYDIHFPHFIQSHYFSFKTPQEASLVAKHIASVCNINHKNIELGLNEVFLNAIEHGNLSITSEEKSRLKMNNTWQAEIEQRLNHPLYQFKQVEVCAELTPTHIIITVTDEGDGFAWRELEQASFSAKSGAYHGRGLLVARSLCFDKMEFSEKGNQVACLVYRAPAS
jgi:anti-sigma regulatory factor (Ser/Thr protein kinase)